MEPEPHFDGLDASTRMRPGGREHQTSSLCRWSLHGRLPSSLILHPPPRYAGVSPADLEFMFEKEKISKPFLSCRGRQHVSKPGLSDQGAVMVAPKGNDRGGALSTANQVTYVMEKWDVSKPDAFVVWNMSLTDIVEDGRVHLQWSNQVQDPERS